MSTTGARASRRRSGVLVVCVALVATCAMVVVPATPALAVDNPPIDDSCGLDVTLVLDASGSIQTSNAVSKVRDAAESFLDALVNTSSNARVTQFATVSEQLAPATLVDDTSMASGGQLRSAIEGYYDPKPPRPSGVNFYQYRGGDPQGAGSWTLNNGSSNNQYTNWDQALGQAGDAPAELVVFVTDGDPTAYDFQAGDPFAPPAVGFNTGSGQAATPTLDRAVAAADQIKASGARMLTVGVGSALSNQASVDRLVAVTGPQVVRDADLADIDSLNDVDVALVTDFDDLTQFMRDVVLQLCSPSLTIRKLAQSADDADFRPAPGWSVTATPTTDSGSFRWILPDTAPGTSKTQPTDGNGFAQYQWEPIPPEDDSAATVSEAVQPGFVAGRDGPGNDVLCALRDQDGNVRVVVSELTVAGADATFSLPTIGQEIVTCTIWNSFAYAPAIAVTKVNAPTEVRGDLTPPATVTSSYVVTNPGNTPLSNVGVTDDTCAPAEGVPASGPNVGDTDADGRLDVTESWQFTCTKPMRVSAVTPAPVTVENTVTAIGTDPEGTTVDATATDDVDVYFPRVSLTKLVDGQTATTVEPGTAVTYTYAVSNTGNTTLGTVTLVDDTPPCQAPTRGPDAPGDDDATLEIGETWTYACTATVDDSVLNTATVTATPLNPAAADAPFAGPNPTVTDTDQAQVDVVDPDIDLQKVAAPDVVLLAPTAGATEQVTYTFTATNTGTSPLNRQGETTLGPAKEPGWVVDTQCLAPAVYVDGDTDDDDLLDPGEVWTFQCINEIDAPTVNVASIIGQPSNADGTPLPVSPVNDLAVAFVDVLRPGIDMVKTALVPVVLDEETVPLAGPDAPVPGPAEYRYEVTNTGNVELSLPAGQPADDICAPLTLESGDTDGDQLVDVDETWVYTCSSTLSRTGDANTPPVTGDESGLVTNTATVTGIPVFDGAAVPAKSVTATDTAQVTVIEPGITITKTPSSDVVRADGDVTYTFVVSNTGDVGLDVIGPADDRCSPLEVVGGDANGNGLLDGADSAAPEQWTFTCTRAVPLPEAGETTDVNSVVVGGIDPLGNLYGATATAEVRVFDPAIDLTKTVSQTLVPSGTTVTYDFVVTNTGNSPLATDDVLGDIQLLDVAAPAQPACQRPTFVGGDTDGDGLLPREPAETWTYRCTAAVTAPTTDVAAVRGTAGLQFDPPLPIDVFAVAAAFVQPFNPAIQVTKSATPTTLVGSGPVTYTYVVRNTGDVPLDDVAARITDDTCSPVTYVSGDEDADGLLDTPNSIFEDAFDETWTFTCTRTVDRTTTNTVVVTGTPVDPGGVLLCAPPDAATLGRVATGCDVSSSAGATVSVVAPGAVTIIKRTPAATSATFDFRIGTESFTLARDGTRTVSNVAPGSYTVTEPTKPGWRLTSLVCTDPTGDSVVTVAERNVVVTVAPGETVTCTFTNAPTGVLPSTGNGPLVRSLGLGAALLGLGGALLLVRRRRHRPAGL